MAALEDDDAWLYGDPNSEEKRGEGKELEKPQDVTPSVEVIADGEFTHTDDDETNGGPEALEKKALEKEAGELSPGDVPEMNHGSPPTTIALEEAGDGEDIVPEEGDEREEAEGEGDGGSDDDDSDDDDVQVTIGDIKSLPAYGYGSTPVNLNIKRVTTFGGTGVTVSGSKSKGIDLETVGTINGLNIYEFNLDSLEDKPWRKPGADITDYFNYGFNEDTWKIYCERQRKLRVDNNVAVKTSHGTTPGGTPLKEGQIPTTTVNENSKYSVPGAGVKKAGPPPGRKMSGSIDVIGGGTPSLPSRRPVGSAKENVIQVIGHMPPGVPPPHLAPTHLPPPNFMGPPPDPAGLSIPTTGSLPPTNVPPPIPVAPFPDYSSGRYGMPPPFEDHFYNGQGSTHGGSLYDPESTSHSWTGSSPRNRDRDRSRDKERYWDHGPREYDRERREREDERRRHHREYSSERTRERYEKGTIEKVPYVKGAYEKVYEKGFEKGSYDKGYDKGAYEKGYEKGGYEKPSTYEKIPYEKVAYDKGYEKVYEKGFKEEYDRDYERERRHKEHRRERDEDKHRSSRRRHHHESDDEPSRSSRHKHKRSKKEKGDDEPSSSAAELSATDAPSASTSPPASGAAGGSSQADNAD